jgi:hypothetical protein
MIFHVGQTIGSWGDDGDGGCIKTFSKVSIIVTL